MAEKRDVEILDSGEQERLAIIQKGIEKKNKEDFTNETWESLNGLLGSTYKNGESFRCAVKDFQSILRGDGENQHKDALPYASTDEEKILELKKERVKIRDERNQYNEYIRNIAREETFSEIALECAKELSKKNPMFKPDTKLVFGEKEAIVMISDWHIGMEFKNGVNEYNSDIAKTRVGDLLLHVIKHCKFHSISKIHVLNLQDLISGWIHTRIRLENRENVIEQIMLVSEMVSEFLQELSKHCLVEYYSSLDNHSRLDPNKKDALKLENFSILINHYLKARLGSNSRVKFNSNEFSEDITTFNVLGHNVVATHGDNDKPSDVIRNLTMLTKKFYDLCLTAHRHHFYASEDDMTVHISNGSLIGVDNYSQDLRMTSRPSQTLVIVSKENPVECIYPIYVG